jgi:menaquinone-dependent protoporphyrinogen oxidase
MTTTRVLLAYHSSEGQAGRVADRIAAVLRDAGAAVDVCAADEAPDPSGFDGVVLGDSIHAGRHSEALTRYVSAHVEELNRMPVALFQVSLTSATADDEHSMLAHDLLRKLLDATGLDPDVVGLFAGALAYTRYGWFKRRLMRSIARRQGGDTDMSRDHEYTDWDAVAEFARDALEHIRQPDAHLKFT